MPTSPALRHSAVKYLLVGAANTFAGLAIIYIYKWLGGGDVVANMIGYGAGLTLSFWLNKSWTFNYGGSVRAALPRFLAVFCIAYLLNLTTVLLATNVFDINGYIAQAVGVLPYTVFGYLASRYFVFRSQHSNEGAIR